jgi:hypothetical protein
MRRTLRYLNVKGDRFMIAGKCRVEVNTTGCLHLRPIAAGVLLATVLFGACGGSGAHSDAPTAPAAVAGALSAVLTTPNTNDGAVLFSVSGGVVDSITPGDVSLYSGSPGSAPAIAAGTIVNGSILAKVWIPDLTAAGNYSATVMQAAARTTYAEQATGAYRIGLTAK